MLQSIEVLTAVKQALRARRLTYHQLARRLRMSESGVKKVLGGGDCSLARLLAICDALDLALADLLREADAPRREPVAFTPTQEAFFLANPQCFYFLWELISNDFDAPAVARAHALDAHAQRLYLTALAAQGCIRRLPGGRVRDAGGFRNGLALPQRLAASLFHAQQHALLLRARAQKKIGDPRNPHDPDALSALGMGTLRLRRESVLELNRALTEVGLEFERRARREAVLARPEDRVAMGLMTVLAPFQLSDVVSLKHPRIKRSTRRPGRARARTPPP